MNETHANLTADDIFQVLRKLYPQKSHPGRAGRKPLPPELCSPNRHYMISISPALAERVREIGNGSLSRGIEELYYRVTGAEY